MRDYLGESIYGVQDTIAVAATNQIVGDVATFDIPVHFILVTYADLACYIAKTSALLTAAADGSQDAKSYIPATGSNILLPWSGTDVWFVNAAAAETPTIHITGII